MTQEQILEGNKLISEFMGAEVSQAYSKTKEQDGLMFYYPKDSSPNTYRNLSSMAIKYHSSFDWLIPVLKEIENLGCIVEIWMSLAYGCRIYKLGGKLSIGKQFTNESNSLEEAVYNTVIEFIKWYNTQNNG